MNNVRQFNTWGIAATSIAVLLMLTFFLYQQTILYLNGIWGQLEDGDYGHGYLVLLISAYLVFFNRQKLAALTPCPELRAVVAVLAASVLWAIAVLVDIEMLQTVGLLLLVLSILWTLLGNRMIQILWFPLLYIGFAIPVWFPFAPVLQELTADAVFWVIRLLEIPALRIENMIVLPAGKLSIEEACSGLRYFLVALTLGTLFAYLNYTTLLSRLLVILISVVAAVLANMLRVFILVYLGYTTDMQHPLIADHVAFGWYVFAGIVVVLLFIDTLWHRMRLHSSNGSLETVEHDQVPCNQAKSQFMVNALAAICFVSTGPAMVYWINNKPQSVSSPTQANLLFDTGGEWTVIDDGGDDWLPLYKGAIDHKMIFQDKDNNEIRLYLGMYFKQAQGEELINELNKISDDRIWHISYQRAKPIEVNGQRLLEQLLQKNDGTRRLVWYWYHVAGRDTVNKYQAKLLQVLGLLNGMQQASIIAIAIDLDDEPEYKREILTRFIEEMGPSLIKEIEGVR